MLTHGFRFLLNAFIIESSHYSIPIVPKHTSCNAFALFQIFTIIGPPMILQSDNGRKIRGAVMTAKQRCWQIRQS